MESPFQWFAMRATYKREMVAKEYLEGKGIEVFVPLKTEIKVIRGIKRKVTVPAINSLIFVYAQKEALQQAKFGVEYLQYLTRKLDGNNIPIIVPSEQMEQFRKVVEDDTIDKKFFAPVEVNLAAGTKVKVHGGALDGYEGILMKQKGKRNKQFFLDVEGVLTVNPQLTNYDLLEVVK
jgi:transcription antitermination factor NusG